MNIDLTELDIYEKFNCLVQNYGEFDTLESVLLELPSPGSQIKKLIAEFLPDEVIQTDNLLREFLVVGSACEAIEFWIDEGHDVEYIINSLMIERGLDVD